MSHPPSNTSVLVIGSGPCGLMLALELGQRGISTVVIDKKPGTAVNPQANATQARTMEYYRRLGFAHEVRALGLPADYPTDIAYFTRYAAYELARFRLPPSSEASALARSSSGSWSTPELLVDVPLAEARDLYEADLALIRPDQVVAWRGSADRLDVDRVMRVVTGHEPVPTTTTEQR